MTVRPPTSMTCVLSSLHPSTSWSVPTAMNRPSRIATAWANGRRSSWVATLPLRTMTSAGPVSLRISGGMAVPPTGRADAPWFVPGLVSVGRLEQPLRGRRLAVDHRVGVLDPLPVRPGVLEHDLHHRVVRLLARPVPWELQEHLLPGDRHRPGLDDPLHGAAVGRLARPAGGVIDRVHLVSGLHRLDGREGEPPLGPKRRHHELLPAGPLDRGHELPVLPGVHAG